MARIRTIKPEFWTDERLAECSVTARLMFIGLFNFADDNGNLVHSAKRIKMQIFPADNIDCDPLLKELVTHGVLMEYSVSGIKYIHIKGFKRHQIINRPSNSMIPQPPLTEDSLREGKGKEEEKKEESKYRFAAKVVKLSEKDYAELKKTYHAIPDFDAELQAADNQYAKEPPGNWYCALGNRLNVKHQHFLSAKKPDKPKRKLENVTEIGVPR